LFAPPKQEDREAALFEAKDSDRGAQETRREGRRPVTERAPDTRHPASLSFASVSRERLLVASGLIVIGFAAIFMLSGRRRLRAVWKRQRPSWDRGDTRRPYEPIPTF
jgi:hypothetical protein